MNIFFLILAIAGGAGLSIQSAVNSRLALGVGTQPVIAAFISFTVGAICLGLVAIFQGNWQQVGANIGHQPWWRWLGGVLGACFVFISVFLAPRIGVAQTMFLFIIGQLIAGMVIDNFGLIQMPARPAQWWSYAGLAIMLCGLGLFTFGSRWFGPH